MRCDACNTKIKGTYYKGDYDSVLCGDCGDNFLVYNDSMGALVYNEFDYDVIYDDDISDIETFEEKYKWKLTQ